MKFIIFLTITFILSSSIVFSQIDTSLKEFYPLKLGNLWQYRDQDNTLYTEQVVKEDTVLPNGKNYFYIKGYYFVRIDSALRILVYGSDPFDDCDTNNEYSIYRLNEPVGSIWKICHNWIDALCGPPYFMQYAGVTQLSNTKETVNILGVEFEIMRFYPGVYCYSENDTMWYYGGIGYSREDWG